jgi:hypothetical protein
MTLADLVNEKKPDFIQKIVSAGENYGAFYCPFVEEVDGQKFTLMGMEVSHASDEAWLTFETEDRSLLKGLQELAGILPEWDSHPDTEKGGILYKRDGMPIRLKFETDAEKPRVGMIYTSSTPGTRLNNTEYQLAAMLLFDEMAALLERAH